MSDKVWILWGEHPEDDQKPSCYEFDTEAEADAFMQGVDAADGWLSGWYASGPNDRYCRNCGDVHGPDERCMVATTRTTTQLTNHQERIQKLVARLRDPNSKQAFGHLRDLDSDAMCCLGHACEVFRLATGEGYWSPSTDEDDQVCMEFVVTPTDRSEAVLPDAVADWFDFSVQHSSAKCNPYVTHAGMSNLVSCLNDEDRLSLPEIAEYFRGL